MPAPLAALGGIIGRGALAGGRGLARGAMRGAAATGRVIRNRSMRGRSPIKTGTEILKRGGGSGGGAIVPFTGGISKISSSSIVPSPRSETSITPVSGKSKSILDVLQQIKSTLSQILEVEKQEKSKLEDTILDFIRRDEREKRDAEQAQQERSKRNKSAAKGKESPIVKKAKKAVGGIWNLISGFVKDFLLYKILDWFSDPKNKKNVKRIVEFFQWAGGFLKNVFDIVIKPLASLLFGGLVESFKIAGKIIGGLISFFSFNWLPNPGEFLKNLLNLPMTILGMVPDMLGKLLNFLTFGLFDNMGNFINNLLSNLNPFNLFGGNKEESDNTAESTEPQKPEQKGDQLKGIDDGIGGALNALNPMNWFGNNETKLEKGEDNNIPKLAEGGIVGKDKKTGDVTVKPLSNLVKESDLSSQINDAIKPFIKLILAPFKIIGTAIVGLILRTVSKIPFVGNLIEPIVSLAATTFGIPSQALSQLKSGTKQDLVKPIDKDELLKDLFGGITILNQSLKEAKQDGINPFQGITSSLGNVASSVGSFLSYIFTPPANAATIPPSIDPSPGGGQVPSPRAPGGGQVPSPGAPGGGQVTPAGTTNSTQVSGFKITSAYGSTEGFRTKAHGGLDIGTPVGTSVALGEDGEIVAAGKYGGYGNLIDAWLPTSGIQLRMAHLSSIIKTTGSFKSGEVIGKTGGAAGDPGAGSSTGPHLHFEVDSQKGGTAYGGSGDPTPFASLLMLGGGTTGIPKPKPGPSPTMTATTNKTGQQLSSVQNESLDLQASASKVSTPHSITTTSSANSSATQSPAGSSLGNTLPNDGLWATFKTNL